MPWHSQILADQLILSQPGGQIMPTYIITTGTPGFSDLLTALCIFLAGYIVCARYPQGILKLNLYYS